METPSTVKRKATIDLTRSDSEDEPPKQRRRVIEIESLSVTWGPTTVPRGNAQKLRFCAKGRHRVKIV